MRSLIAASLLVVACTEASPPAPQLDAGAEIHARWLSVVWRAYRIGDCGVRFMSSPVTAYESWCGGAPKRCYCSGPLAGVVALDPGDTDIDCSAPPAELAFALARHCGITAIDTELPEAGPRRD